MYEKGDCVICPNGMMATITETICGASGKAKEYVLQSGNITWHVFAGEQGIIRKVVSKDEMLEILSRIPYIRTIQAPNNKIRAEFYEEAMEAYDEVEWIKVIKTVYIRGGEQKLAPGEEAYAQKAKKFFYGEVSILLDIPENEVEAYITHAIEEGLW